MTQTAHRLSHDLGGTPDAWKSRLTNILSGREVPTSDLVTRIDALWARQDTPPPGTDTQGMLF